MKNEIIAIERSLNDKKLFRTWTRKEAEQINIYKKGLSGFIDYVKNNNNKTCKIKLLINIKGA